MVKIQEGLKIKKEYYKEFGKFIINLNLLQDNILLVKYASYAPVPSLRRTPISNGLKYFISHLLDTGEINYQIGRELSEIEKNLLINLMSKSGLKTHLKFDKAKLQEDIDDLIKTFSLLQGEVMAGNNNLKSEIKAVVNKLVAYGKISQVDGNEILSEL